MASFTQLDELCLDTVNLEELNLDPLLSLKSLKVLSLVRSRVRDVELKKLQKLPHLEILGVTVDGSIREQLEIINGFKNLKTIYIERSDPHLCFNISSDQFRKLLSENAELHDDTQLLPILAAPAKRKRAEADARAAIENPAEP